MKYFEEFPETTSKGIPRFKLNRPLVPLVPGDVGLELEIEGEGLPPCPTRACPVTKARWIPHADGSLRGESVEYVLSNPADISSVPDMVRDIYTAFTDNGTNLRLSNRCSTHVHLNVSGWKVNHLSSFLALWSAIEPALIDWCGTERKSNHFCLGIEDTQATLESWVDFLRTGDLHFREGLKYTALNIRHLTDFGSFEVRTGRAWPEPEACINWTKFLWAFRNFVFENFANPLDVPDYVSHRQAEGVVREVATLAGIPAFADQIYLSSTDMNRRGFETFRNAQTICYAFPWDDWLPEIQKVFVVNPFEKSFREFTPPPLERVRPAAFREIQQERRLEEDRELEILLNQMARG